ncbi:hypothetical protein Bca52824_029748 [Brassica carinata]|uniref:Fibronectin type III-like domain-containing protein n=1 Tax=Brassica carinata TaxID=52824 RepID=A0A8X7V3T9_BRACI|nr:hypothetical protein Bca52824_029748 [Brassica carinata]
MGSSSPLTRRKRAPTSVLSILLVILCFSASSNAQSTPVFACDVAGNSSLSTYGFCNTALKIEARVADLVGRLTLQEKIGFLVNKANGVTRLGIPTYEWWSEALHGVSYIGPGTHFSGQVPGATTSSNAQSTPVFACDVAGNSSLSTYGFCNTALKIEARVADLVGRLTLQEKIGFLVNKANGVTRLGIPTYEWWSEALHGVSYIGPGTHFSGQVPGATSFPQVILTAASFNVSLFQAIGKVVSTEARAMYNVGLAGLTYWSPNVNIFRDPRWGRGQETPGEDPLLSSKYASGYVKGLQETESSDANRLKVAACCKHYTAYDVDNWKGVERYTFNAVVNQQDMDDTYQPPFKSCVVDGNVASVMCSYNQVNGKPTCADPDLLSGVIRGQWKLNGYIVSDCDSVDVLYKNQHYTKTRRKLQLYLSTQDSSMEIQRSKSGGLGPKDVCTPLNQELAAEAARQGIVLLKNTGSLPLSPTTIKTLAVIGCSNVACAVADVDAATKLAADADATVLVIGADQSIEAESRDRVDLNLPGKQQDLVTQVAKAAKGPVLLVIMSGGGFDVTFAKNDAKIAESYGLVILEKLEALPSLTSFLAVIIQKVPMTNMNMRPDTSNGYPGRTYRFYTGETSKLLHGSSLRLEENHVCRSSECQSLDALGPHCENTVGTAFEVHVKVRNGGDREGIHTVFLFTTPPAVHGSPRKHLLGFEKIRLGKMEEVVVKFKVDVCEDLSVVDEVGKRKIGLGQHLLHVGDLKHSLSIRI